jgi:GH25 family lysozyme M1 (1,4-beta-N-acetylmuramidase)
MRACGIDLSKYDLSFSPSLATKKADFVIQRVGYGGFWGTVNKDEAFDKLLPGVLEVPIRGSYWYLSSHPNWMRQADFYLETMGTIPYHFHCVDFESAYNDMSIDFGAECIEFARYVKEETGKPVLLYTNRSLYDELLAPDYRARDIPLWISSPVGITVDPQFTQPPMPRKRADWALWQYTWTVANAKAWGVGRPTSLDVNVFNGTVADMRLWLGMDVVIPPTPVLTTDGRLARLEKLHNL